MPVLAEDERVEQADRFCSNLGIQVRHGGDHAFYSPAGDFVQMPEFRKFHDCTAYYAVLLHECGHASGAKHRPDRDLSGRFGSESYAMEECVVELLFTASSKAQTAADWMHSQQPEVADEYRGRMRCRGRQKCLTQSIAGEPLTDQRLGLFSDLVRHGSRVDTSRR